MTGAEAPNAIEQRNPATMATFPVALISDPPCALVFFPIEVIVSLRQTFSGRRCQEAEPLVRRLLIPTTAAGSGGQAWPCRLPAISAAFDLRSTDESDPYLYRCTCGRPPLLHRTSVTRDAETVPVSVKRQRIIFFAHDRGSSDQRL
jgi:hypothetical protein